MSQFRDVANPFAFPPYNHHDSFATYPYTTTEASSQSRFSKYYKTRHEISKLIENLYQPKNSVFDVAKRGKRYHHKYNDLENKNNANKTPTWNLLKPIHTKIEQFLDNYTGTEQQFAPNPVHLNNYTDKEQPSILREKNSNVKDNVFKTRKRDTRGGVLVGKYPMKCTEGGHSFKVEILDVHNKTGSFGAQFGTGCKNPGQEGIWLGCSLNPFCEDEDAKCKNRFHPQTIPLPFARHKDAVASPQFCREELEGVENEAWWISTDADVSLRGPWTAYLPFTRGPGRFNYQHQPVELPKAQIGDVYEFRVTPYGEMAISLNGEKVAFATAKVPNRQGLYPMVRLWGRVTKVRVLV